jgi:hypothetical protein
MGGMGAGTEPPWTPEQKAAIIAELRREYPDRQLYPVQRGNLASQWEALEHSAQLADAHNQDSRESSVPPNLAALVGAVRRTRLSRFYPFTGHEYLYFKDGPGVWDHQGEVAPVCIGRNRPEGYLVLHNLQGRVICALTTHDPDEAAAEAERLLAGWAWGGQG